MPGLSRTSSLHPSLFPSPTCHLPLGFMGSSTKMFLGSTQNARFLHHHPGLRCRFSPGPQSSGPPAPLEQAGPANLSCLLVSLPASLPHWPQHTAGFLYLQASAALHLLFLLPENFPQGPSQAYSCPPGISAQMITPGSFPGVLASHPP